MHATKRPMAERALDALLLHAGILAILLAYALACARLFGACDAEEAVKVTAGFLLGVGAVIVTLYLFVSGVRQ